MIKYYNQIQNTLNLLYDKIVLLHSFIDDKMFHVLKWKIQSKKKSWHEIYWNALKKTYQEYKSLHNDIVKIKQKLIIIVFNLNDMFDDDDMQQNYFEKNEFKIYHWQNKIFKLCIDFCIDRFC